jgi:hypothetical protein
MLTEPRAPDHSSPGFCEGYGSLGNAKPGVEETEHLG